MGKAFLICIAIFVAGIGLMIFEESKLTLAQKHARDCQNHSMAAVMALKFAKSSLNLADQPEFETFGSARTTKLLRPNEANCSIEIADHITFKNEMGGKSRRYLYAVVAPDPDNPGTWRLRDISIR